MILWGKIRGESSDLEGAFHEHLSDLLIHSGIQYSLQTIIAATISQIPDPEDKALNISGKVPCSLRVF